MKSVVLDGGGVFSFCLMFLSRQKLSSKGDWRNRGENREEWRNTRWEMCCLVEQYVVNEFEF